MLVNPAVLPIEGRSLLGDHLSDILALENPILIPKKKLLCWSEPGVW
jgi:hypothetical protein